MPHKIPIKLDGSWRMEGAIIAQSVTDETLKNEIPKKKEKPAAPTSATSSDAAVLQQMQDKAVKEAAKPTPTRRPSSSGSSSGYSYTSRATSSASSRRLRHRELSQQPKRRQTAPSPIAKRGRSRTRRSPQASRATRARASSSTARQGQRASEQQWTYNIKFLQVVDHPEFDPRDIAKQFSLHDTVGVETTSMFVVTSLDPDSVHTKISAGVPPSCRVFYNKRGRFAIRAPSTRQPQRPNGQTSGARSAPNAHAGQWRRQRPQQQQKQKAASKTQFRPAQQRARGPQAPSHPPPQAHREQEPLEAPRRKPRHRNAARAPERTWPAGERPPSPPPPAAPQPQVVSQPVAIMQSLQSAPPEHIASFLRSVATLLDRPRPSEGIRILDVRGNQM